mgnify:CR=1 FL=1
MAQNKRRTPAIPLRDQREPFAGFHRFPYFQEAAPVPANPVIDYRTVRQWIGLFKELGLYGQATSPFPYFEQPKPVIGMRYGQGVLVGTVGEAYMVPSVYYTFPFAAGLRGGRGAAIMLAQRPPITDPKRLRARIHRRPH